MLKILTIVDKVDTALDRLAKGVAKYHNNLDYVVVDVHPKRPDQAQLDRFAKEAQDADIIDAQYYRSLYMLRERFPWLKDKKTILTHNNPYAIEEQQWNDVELNVGNNHYICDRLSEITETPVEYIPLTVDTDFWIYNQDWDYTNKVSANNGYQWQGTDTKPSVIMVANRIESKKGILEVAIACGELGIQFRLVGAISDQAYFYDIMQTGNVEFHEQISDEALRDLYYKSTIHVCNSTDNFESGTLPILEAMLCGVPILTRKVGHVPELYNGENMVIHEGAKEDVLAIRDSLFNMLNDKKKLAEMRDKAWNTAKSRSFERRAFMYQKLYRQVMWPDEKAVSVVMPIYDKPDIIRKSFSSVTDQTYKNLEIILVDDNPYDNQETVENIRRFSNIPVRYINSSRRSKDISDYQIEDYGLARARNIGTIEATGEIMVYCDQRMVMEPNAIEEFLRKIAPRTWLYGNKGAKKEFVENFSCVYRNDVINAGMFCERMDAYGGLSQETRTRFKNQGGRTEYVETAKANPAGKSSNRNRKREDIIRIKNRLFKMYGD